MHPLTKVECIGKAKSSRQTNLFSLNKMEQYN